MDLVGFFEGFILDEVPTGDPDIRHYAVRGHEVDCFHTCHPAHMRNIGGPLQVLDRLRTLLRSTGLVPDFPSFLDDGAAGDACASLILEAAYRPDCKYAFIAWLATELKRHSAYMSVPRLVMLLNERGYRTDYDTPYRTKRGSYRLVRGAYIREMQAGNHEGAMAIAEAFRKPDFTYAY